jgi:hypothetical protein
VLRSRIFGRLSVVAMALTASLPIANASAQSAAQPAPGRPLVANPPAGSGRPVVVVLQSGLGTASGDALRAELARRFELDVTTVRDGNLANAPPRAMLTLAIDERGELNAIYWDDAGGFEVFSAPAPKDQAALSTAALTLATALVQRHLDTLRSDTRGMANRELTPKDLELMQRAALYSMLVRRGSIGRLAVQLRAEDF